ncbi:MAG: hypothetical protein KH009_04725 [Clostridiales bacterium]|nr:hypothetical protein [Clostridiales bacterium]
MFKRQRQRKVKRYQNIYRGSIFASPFFKLAAALGCLAFFAAVGWLMYEPAYQFIMGLGSEPGGEESSSQTSGAAESSVPEGNGGFLGLWGDGETSSESSSQPEEVEQAALHAAYMPENILMDPSLRSAFIQDCAAKGINGILFDLKNDKGVVTYRSGLSQVTELGSMSASAVDLPTVVEEMRSAGIRPVGRIYAFKDPLASSANLLAAVQYSGSEWAWLDNSADLGGKTWLNPLSDYAQQYITDLSVEATGVGVEEILLDTVHFPVGYSVELASYGRTVTEAEKSAELAAFLNQAEQQVTAAGGSLSVYLSAPNLLDSSGSKYGSDPYQLTVCPVVLGVMPASFGNVYNSSELVLESPVQSPYRTVQSALEIILPRLKTEKVSVLLQGYTAGNLNALNNKTYTAADVEEQIRAAEESGINSYLLYSPAGDYSILSEIQ